MIQCQPCNRYDHTWAMAKRLFRSMAQYIVGFVLCFDLFCISIGRNRKCWINRRPSDDDDVDEEIADAYFDDEDSDDYSVEKSSEFSRKCRGHYCCFFRSYDL